MIILFVLKSNNVVAKSQRFEFYGLFSAQGFFHSKGTWGCAACNGILFWPSSLAKGILFGNFSRV